MSVPFSTQQFEEKPNPRMPVRKVRLDKIIATQTQISPAKMRSIREHGDNGPPPMVHPHRGFYHATDGHTRIAAAMEKGETHMKVRVVK